MEKDIIRSSMGTTKKVVQVMSRLYHSIYRAVLEEAPIVEKSGVEMSRVEKSGVKIPSTVKTGKTSSNPCLFQKRAHCMTLL